MGNAVLDGQFPIRLIRPIYPIYPIRPYFSLSSLSLRITQQTKKKTTQRSSEILLCISGGQDWHRYARPTSFTIISKRNVMHHDVSLFLAISVLQVNMHTLITKKDSLLRVLHYITLDAEGTGFEWL